jgi:hypothetical protein
VAVFEKNIIVEMRGVRDTKYVDKQIVVGLRAVALLLMFVVMSAWTLVHVNSAQ